MSAPLHTGPNPNGCVPNEGSTSEVVNGHKSWDPRASPLIIRSAAAASFVGAKFSGRLRLLNDFPRRRVEPVRTPSHAPPRIGFSGGSRDKAYVSWDGEASVERCRPVSQLLASVGSVFRAWLPE
eukprot:2713414-Pyramimonas_sp.AAC.3